MPRQRRTMRKNRVNLASLVQRARHHPYNLRHSVTAHSEPEPELDPEPLPTTVLQSSGNYYLKHLQQRRRRRRLLGMCYNDAIIGSPPTSSNQLHMSTAEVEIPYCGAGAQMREIETMDASHSPFLQDTTFSTIVLHRNPRFDADGNTRSGLLRSNNKTSVHPNRTKKRTTAKKTINRDSSNNKKRRKIGASPFGIKKPQAHSKPYSLPEDSSDGSGNSDSEQSSNSFDGANDCITMMTTAAHLPLVESPSTHAAEMEAARKWKIAEHMQVNSSESLPLSAAAAGTSAASTATMARRKVKKDEVVTSSSNATNYFKN